MDGQICMSELVEMPRRESAYEFWETKEDCLSETNSEISGSEMAAIPVDY